MDPSTGSFISMDSYQGSLYDPVSLHKYLYANANPVMYTDPSGYFSLMGQIEATSIQSELSSCYASVMRIGMQLMAQIKALKSVYSVGIISSTVLLGIGLTVSDVDSGTQDISIELLKQSLNTMVFAYISMSIAVTQAVTASMEASQAHVEAMSDRVEQYKEYRRNSVYLLREHDSPFKVHYVGRTKDPWTRSLQHKRDKRKTTDGVSWDMWVVVSGLTLEEAKALEQSLICIYTIGALANARYEIAEKNYENFGKEINRAAEIAKIPLPDLKKAMER